MNRHVKRLPDATIDDLRRRAPNGLKKWTSVIAIAIELAADGPLPTSRRRGDRTSLRRDLLDELRRELVINGIDWRELQRIRRAEELG